VQAAAVGGCKQQRYEQTWEHPDASVKTKSGSTCARIPIPMANFYIHKTGESDYRVAAAICQSSRTATPEHRIMTHRTAGEPQMKSLGARRLAWFRSLFILAGNYSYLHRMSAPPGQKGSRFTFLRYRTRLKLAGSEFYDWHKLCSGVSQNSSVGGQNICRSVN
jgi:hypothetical protein